MQVSLESRGTGENAKFDIPAVYPAPTIVVWGERIFQAVPVEKGSPTVYVEAFAWTIPPGQEPVL